MASKVLFNTRGKGLYIIGCCLKCGSLKPWVSILKWSSDLDDFGVTPILGTPLCPKCCIVYIHIYIYMLYRLQILFLKNRSNQLEFLEKTSIYVLSLTGWWFGTWMDYFPIQLGMESSSQRTFTNSYFWGVGQPTTNQISLVNFMKRNHQDIFGSSTNQLSFMGYTLW